MPKISIITPAYIEDNAKLQWLAEMVNSVKAQDFTDWEIIIVDDHSPLQPIIQDDDGRVRVFRMAGHSGPSICRNTAIAIADSEALLPIDADDLLPTTDILEKMYNIWEQDKRKTVYGNLQFYNRKDDGFQAGRVVKLPDYSFQAVLDPRGLMPVTALHSKDCHYAAGGWKPELDTGLEDIEYWIAAGEAGFCGKKIDIISLLYRRHKNSRHNRMRDSYNREAAMRQKIIELHKDVYDGKEIMGMCGCNSVSKQPYQQPVSNSGAAAMSRGLSSNAASIAAVSETQKVWVEYIGKRDGSFDVNGPFSGITYKIYGYGYKFQVHANDLPKFKLSGRGQDFRTGVAPPDGTELQAELPSISNPTVIKPQPVGTPAIGKIERYDQRAAAKFAMATG